MTYALCSNAIILTSNRRYLKKLADCKQKTKRGANLPPRREIMDKIVIDLTPSWVGVVKCLMAVVETHAKESFFKDGANRLIRAEMLKCAEVADEYVKQQKLIKEMPNVIK